MMASAVTDFPEPDSPTSPSTSPAAMENERLRTAASAAPAAERTERRPRLRKLDRQVADFKQRGHEGYGISARDLYFFGRDSGGTNPATR